MVHNEVVCMKTEITISLIWWAILSGFTKTRGCCDFSSPLHIPGLLSFHSVFTVLSEAPKTVFISCLLFWFLFEEMLICDYHTFKSLFILRIFSSAPRIGIKEEREVWRVSIADVVGLKRLASLAIFQHQVCLLPDGSLNIKLALLLRRYTIFAYGQHKCNVAKPPRISVLVSQDGKFTFQEGFIVYATYHHIIFL